MFNERMTAPEPILSRERTLVLVDEICTLPALKNMNEIVKAFVVRDIAAFYGWTPGELLAIFPAR